MFGVCGVSCSAVHVDFGVDGSVETDESGRKGMVIILFIMMVTLVRGMGNGNVCEFGFHFFLQK